MRLTLEDAMSLVLPGCPNSWADLASEAEAGQRWNEAAACWWNAKGASIGHNRRARYEDAAKRCQIKAQIAATETVVHRRNPTPGFMVLGEPSIWNLPPINEVE